MITGLNGTLSEITIAKPADEHPLPLSDSPVSSDLDLKRMAEWALNYLIRSPRPELGYEPVFQCHPLRCPPIPAGHDVVVPCDTDARMNLEWYYMRDITGSQAGQPIEVAFHARLLSYLGEEGLAWAHSGAYNEGDIDHHYTEKDKVIHTWGSAKILHALAEDYTRTHQPETRRLALKTMRAIKSLTTWDGQGRCWLPGGMGAVQRDGIPLANNWNAHPLPIIEPLLACWRAIGDEESLDFARAYSRGIIQNSQPNGIRFAEDGSFWLPDNRSVAHSHATLHSLWGIADLGLTSGESTYLDFAQRSWDWMMKRGTGTGWFPAMTDNCNETCCLSDMISLAAILGQAGRLDAYDCLERFFRNYISNLQFIMTPEFEAYYRRLNASAGDEAIRSGLAALHHFEGGIIGGSGLNDYENELLGGASGFEMFGCCAPEGMRALYTAWKEVIQRRPARGKMPAGVYVNLCLNRDSEWGKVVSFMPEEGRLTVIAGVNATFFLRSPSWAEPSQVRLTVNQQSRPVEWTAGYTRIPALTGDELTLTYPLMRFTQQVDGLWPNCRPDLSLKFNWLGNSVLSCDPAPTLTPLFTGEPRHLPQPPAFE